VPFQALNLVRIMAAIFFRSGLAGTFVKLPKLPPVIRSGWPASISGLTSRVDAQLAATLSNAAMDGMINFLIIILSVVGKSFGVTASRPCR
jgi:hypothetical protein